MNVDLPFKIIDKNNRRGGAIFLILCFLHFFLLKSVLCRASPSSLKEEIYQMVQKPAWKQFHKDLESEIPCLKLLKHKNLKEAEISEGSL